jgi:hypothetical protein
MDLFGHKRPWIFWRMSSWVVNALWNDLAFRLPTFLCVCNFEVHVEKKIIEKHQKAGVEGKQSTLTNKIHPTMNLCLKSQLHNPEAYSEHGTSCNERRMEFRFPAGAPNFLFSIAPCRLSHPHSPAFYTQDQSGRAH